MNEQATYYVVDTTVKPQQVKQFPTYKGLVIYLEHMCKRAYGQSRIERTRLLEETGHGTDDFNATLFVRSMQEQFNIGVVRDGRLTQCDVTVMVAYQKPEYGD